MTPIRLIATLGVGTLAGLLTVSAVAETQWLNEPTRGIPRNADGRPDLNAPAPRLSAGTPDLSGLWTFQIPPGYVTNIAADLDAAAISPTATRLFDQRMSEFGKDDPSTIGCLPMGPRHILGVGRVKVIHTPTLIVILYEDLSYRQIHLDGRELPKDPNPSFMGYSVGRWAGDTLEVESIGFNDRTWLDYGGHPHSERLRVMERFRRVSSGRIEREITFTDNELYRVPIIIRGAMNLLPDTELLEYVCAENPRTRPHLVGRTDEEKEVVVPADVLATYVGTYDVVGRPEFGITLVTVSLSNGRLFVDFNGKGQLPMIPLSQTMFSPRLLGTFEFMKDSRGIVTHVFAHAAEGRVRFDRRP